MKQNMTALNSHHVTTIRVVSLVHAMMIRTAMMLTVSMSTNVTLIRMIVNCSFPVLIIQSTKTVINTFAHVRPALKMTASPLDDIDECSTTVK